MTTQSSYGIAVFSNKDGQRVVYQLTNPVPCELGTDLSSFSPRSLDSIQVSDHNGPWIFYFRPGDVMDVTEEAESAIAALGS